MNRKLGLNLKAFRHDRERLNKRTTHSTIASHNVIKSIAINPLNHESNEIITESMKGSFVFFGICSVGKTVTNGHIGLTIKDWQHHINGFSLIIRVVTIDHQIAISIDITKHLATNVTFPLARLEANDRTMLPGNLRSVVRRIVIVYIYHCTRQGRMVVIYHFTDG